MVHFLASPLLVLDRYRLEAGLGTSELDNFSAFTSDLSELLVTSRWAACVARSQEQSEVDPGPGGEGLPGDHPQKFNVDTVPRIGKRDTGAFTKHHFGVFMLEVLGCKKVPNIWMGFIVLHVPF